MPSTTETPETPATAATAEPLTPLATQEVRWAAEFLRLLADLCADAVSPEADVRLARRFLVMPPRQRDKVVAIAEELAHGPVLPSLLRVVRHYGTLPEAVLTDLAEVPPLRPHPSPATSPIAHDADHDSTTPPDPLDARHESES